jgi:ribonuclease HII
MTIQIGIDEVGRGAGFGPFTMAVVRIDSNIAKNEIKVKDSKKLSAEKREAMFSLILDAATYYEIINYSSEQVDELGVEGVTKLAIKTLVEHIRKEYPDEIIYMDGSPSIRLPKLEYIIKGDSLIPAISAASIIAKVHRDKLVSSIQLSNDYGINSNKGYLTKQHIDSIKKYGITKHHRKTFLKNYI